MKKILFISSAFFLALSCGETRIEKVLQVQVLPFNAEGMYDADKVEDYLFDTEEMDVDSLRDEARKLFLAGIDLFVNKKNTKESLEKFKASIAAYPDAKTYYELGKALLELGYTQKSKDNSIPNIIANSKPYFEESLKAFAIAERLHFEPRYQVNYHMACADNLLYELKKMENKEDDPGSNYMTVSDLRNAFMNGFSDTAMANKDPRLLPFTLANAWKFLVADMMANTLKDGKNALFNVFKNAFPTLSGDFVIESDRVDMLNYTESISYDFAAFIPEMENTEFGREVSHDYFYVGKLAETKEYVALIYSSVSFWGEEMQPVHTILATYAPDGKLISRKMIACQCSATRIKIASINDGKITIEEINREWAEPFDQVPFDQNRVSKFETVAKASFTIENSGKISDLNVPAEFKDSTLIVKE